MTFPRMSHIYKSRDMTQVFKGYNHNLRIADGEFYDESGLTTDNYPVLSVRKAHVDTGESAYKVVSASKRFDIKDSNDGSTIISWTDDTGLHEIPIQGHVEQTVMVGRYLLVYPQALWIDTSAERLVGYIDNRSDVVAAGFTFVDKNSGVAYIVNGDDGSDALLEEDVYQNLVVTSEDEPSFDGIKILWYKESTKELHRFSYIKNGWEKIEGSFKLEFVLKLDNIGYLPFKEMDYLRVRYQKTSNNIDMSLGSIIVDSVLTNTDGEGHYITVSSDTIGSYETGYEGLLNDKNAKRTVYFWQPVMDFYCEWNGRLWGCRSGLDENGKLVNEIRCTAYRADNPSFREWERSYETDEANAAVFSLTSPGEFTGAAVFNGSLYFFKENTIHRVTGNDFTSFQVIDYTAPGVQAGSADSVQVFNGALYYKGVEAVYRYDGSYPVSVSDEFANEPYKAATGGTKGHKYYLSMQSANKWSMMVYDAKLGIWHREGAIHATSFARVGNDLYYTDANSRVHCIGSTAGKTKVRWFAETGIIGLDDPDSKYYSQIAVRMNLPFGSSVAIDIQYDSCGKWETVKAFASTSAMRNVTLPVKLRRCDHLQMRFSGVGDCTIYSVTKTIEGGSDQ